MNKGRLLMISTDRKIFEKDSEVRSRQVEYAKDWDEVHIVIFAKKESKKVGQQQLPNETVISPNCFVYSTCSFSKILYPFDAIKLGRFIIEKRGITNITCQDPSLTAMAGLSLKREFMRLNKSLPVEIQVHGDIGSPYYAYNWSNKIRKVLANKYLLQADSIRVVSEKLKNYLIEKLGIDGSKISVRPIRVDVDWIRTVQIKVDLHTKYSQFEQIILMASRLEREKNISLALTAFKKVLEMKPETGLIIVGDGSQQSDITKKASELRVNENVIIEPWVNKDTLASYYKTADLFLVTSLFEGYGMTLVEAKAAGIPIVSTDVGVAREMGAIISHFDATDMADKILGTLQSKKIK